MKKNITINLCGRLYQIDEDAYELLSHYTETLRNYFLKQEGGKEIADDIEERVAELFDDLKTQGIEAITIEHVQDIIHQIGQVEEIAGEEASSNSSKGEKDSADGAQKESKPLIGKKFFRDSQNKLLAGVLAGCAHFYGGTANSWRWGYVIICALWFCFVGFGPVTFSLPFDGFLSLLAVPFLMLTLPFMVLPLVAYLLVVIFTPETKTPEDVLQMKGKEVNPQNLTTEVQEATLVTEKKKSDVSAWDIFLGILSIGLSTIFGLGFLVALCFFVAFLAAHELMADRWWNIYRPEEVQAITMPAIFSGVMLLVSIGILLYSSIHAAVSSFGKIAAWHIRQRIIWFLLWVASAVGFVGCTMWAVGLLAKAQTARWDREAKEYAATHHTDAHGHEFSQTDWDFFEKEGWELVNAGNTDRYTYSGEWMTGDPDVRYLDACNWNDPVTFEAQKREEVQPGIYRLSAAVRSDNDTSCEKYIFVSGQDSIAGDTYKNGLLSSLAKIPHNGNLNGNIWKTLVMKRDKTMPANPSQQADPVVAELVSRIPESDQKKILEANNRSGFGWNYVYIDSIIVTQPATLTYGVRIDEEENPPALGWFSATDFQLERIGDTH